MPSLKDSRFGIAEHLAEQFSSNCNSACQQENIDPSLKAACDSGSQSYCIKNITANECQVHLDRVIQTRARVEQKEMSPYANPINIPKTSSQTVTDYYNALGDAASTYITSNLKTLSPETASSILTIMQAEEGEKTMFNKITSDVMSSCVNSKDSTCKSNDIVIKVVDKAIGVKYKEFKDANINAVIDYIYENIEQFKHFSSYYDPLVSLINDKMDLNSLSNPKLISLRAVSPKINQIYFMKYITEVSPEKQNVSVEDLDLSRQIRLYDPFLRSVYQTLLTLPFQHKDILVVKIKQADARNKELIFSPFEPIYEVLVQNGLKPSVDSLLKNTASQLNLSEEDARLAFYYAYDNNANIFDQKGVEIINKLNFDGLFVQREREIHPIILYIFSKIKQSKIPPESYLKTFHVLQKPFKSLFNDTITTDAKGVVSITHSEMCKRDPEQCKSFCLSIPEMCIDDQIQRCQLPDYRYQADSQSKESFNDKCSSETMWWILILTIIIFGGSMIFFTRRFKYGSKISSLQHETDTELNNVNI